MSLSKDTKVYVFSRTSPFDKEVISSNGARNYPELGPAHKNTNTSSPNDSERLSVFLSYGLQMIKRMVVEMVIKIIK